MTTPSMNPRMLACAAVLMLALAATPSLTAQIPPVCPADADCDGLSDTDEVLTAGTDPLNPDSDADGLSDGDEVNVHGTDPLNPDTDGETLTDGAEVNQYGTDPLLADTDADGLDDAVEVNDGTCTDPRVADTDGDGLTDGAEALTHGTDPCAADTDADGSLDGIEVAYGSNPLDDLSRPPVVAWSFDEASGDAIDSSGHGHHGTFTGNATRVAGPRGNAVLLDGEGHVHFTDVTRFPDMAHGFTVEAWVNPSEHLHRMMAVNLEDTLEFALGHDGELIFAIRSESPGWIWRHTGLIIPLDTWTHVRMTYDVAAEAVCFWVDDVLAFADAATGSVRVMDSLERAGFTAGFRGGGWDNAWHGQLDEVVLHSLPVGPACTL